MERFLPSYAFQYLLLAYVLAPWLGAALAMGVWTSTRGAMWAGRVVYTVMLATSLLLAARLIVPLLASANAAVSQVAMVWALPGATQNPGLFTHVLWGVDLLNVPLLLLLPWVTLTSSLTTPHKSRERGLLQLLLLAGGALFVVGWDVASYLMGVLLTGGTLSLVLARHGVRQPRQPAGMLFTVLIIGVVLLAAGLAGLVACGGIMQGAPFSLPDESTTLLPQLMEQLRNSVARHPASQFLWEEVRGWPIVLTFTAVLLLSASFPLHFWLRKLFAAGATSQRVWLWFWTQAILWTSFRLMRSLDVETQAAWAENLLTIALPGLCFGSLVLLASPLHRNENSLAALLLVSNQWLLIFALILPPDHSLLLEAFFVSQLAAGVAMVLSFDEPRVADSPTRAGRCGPCGACFLAAIVLNLPATTLGLWLIVQVVGSATLTSSRWGVFGLLLVLASILFQLAGTVRLGWHACWGSASDSMAGGSSSGFPPTGANAPVESAAESPPVVVQRLAWGWGILAFLIATLSPLLVLGH